MLAGLDVIVHLKWVIISFHQWSLPWRNNEENSFGQHNQNLLFSIKYKLSTVKHVYLVRLVTSDYNRLLTNYIRNFKLQTSYKSIRERAHQLSLTWSWFLPCSMIRLKVLNFCIILILLCTLYNDVMIRTIVIQIVVVWPDAVWLAAVWSLLAYMSCKFLLA